MTKFHLLAGLLTIGTVAHAGLLDISFYSSFYNAANTSPGPPSGAAVLGQPGDVWNYLDVNPCGPCGPYSLVDSTGTAVGAQVSETSDGGVLSLAQNTQPLPALTNTYLFGDSGDSTTVTLTNLAIVPYTLVLYVASDDGGGGDRNLSGTVLGATAVGFSATGIPQASFVDGQNVVELSVTPDALGTLTILETNPSNASGEIDFNGLQLSSTPEPGACLTALAGLVLLAARKRRR